MTQERARYPQLLVLGHSSPGQQPTLIGHECRGCGRRAFPPDPYGCERCGASEDRLEPITLTAVGTITAVATVHRHHNPWPETPFTVATIVLDDGISLKGVLAGDGGGASPGDRVRGVTAVAGEADDGARLMDLHWAADRPAGDRGPSGGSDR